VGKLLFEFEDQPWFPQLLRGYMTDYLQFIFNKFDMYKPVVHELNMLMENSNKNTIVDLCSGSGGPLMVIRKNFIRQYNKHISIILTDKFIPKTTINNLPEGISYHKQPIDAIAVPIELKGLRTMFSSLHHLNTEEIKQIIINNSQSGEPFAFFDSGDKNIIMILSIIIFHPILMIVFTPFIKPFSLLRIIFTYIIPLVMFFTIWDGLVSIINLYSKENLCNLTNQLQQLGISCRLLELKNKLGMKIIGITS
jgi:hypothetical protein